MLMALAAVAVVMAQPPGNEFHGWLRSGNVEALARRADDYYPTLTHSGTLYFSSNRPGGAARHRRSARTIAARVFNSGRGGLSP